jgi:hypothetical protein
MKDFDLEPGNVDMEMADQFGEWGQYEEIEEEDDTDTVLAQVVELTNPSAQE